MRRRIVLSVLAALLAVPLGYTPAQAHDLDTSPVVFEAAGNLYENSDMRLTAFTRAALAHDHVLPVAGAWECEAIASTKRPELVIESMLAECSLSISGGLWGSYHMIRANNPVPVGGHGAVATADLVPGPLPYHGGGSICVFGIVTYRNSLTGQGGLGLFGSDCKALISW